MAFVKWDPWREIEDLFDRYVKAGGISRIGADETIAAGDWAPRVDISETDGEFVIKADIPDVKREDVHLSVSNGVMTLKGERKQETEEKGKKFHRIERHYGSFCRSFTLPEGVDPAKVSAAFKDGSLTVKLPKTTESKPKAIDIAVE